MHNFSALLHSELPWLTLLALVLAWLLLRFRRYERAVFLNTLWVFLIGVVGQGVAVLLEAMAFSGAATVVHGIFRLVSAIAVIRLLGFAVFRLLLPLVGREPPRIIEDLAIVGAYVVYGFAHSEQLRRRKRK